MTDAIDLTTPTPEDVVRLVRRLRLPLHDEKALQAAMATEFDRVGWRFVREARLSAQDIPDFLFPTGEGDACFVAEVKVKGSKREIHAQARRYLLHARVEGLVLVTNVPMGFPPEVEGKPCWVASLGRGWL